MSIRSTNAHEIALYPYVGSSVYSTFYILLCILRAVSLSSKLQ